MATNKSSKARKVSPRNSKPAAAAKGAALAATMLRGLEQNTAAANGCLLDPTYRNGPQRNIVLQFLDKVGTDRAAQAGFASILSDYVASCASGAIPDAGGYDVTAQQQEPQPEGVTLADFDATECRDAIDASLAKARGVLFVISELHNAESSRELVSSELEGSALWALRDLLDDAAASWERLQLAGFSPAK